MCSLVFIKCTFDTRALGQIKLFPEEEEAEEEKEEEEKEEVSGDNCQNETKRIKHLIPEANTSKSI